MVSYYLPDAQGSIRTLTSANGMVTDGYTYDAFGVTQNHTGTTVNPYQYTGQQFDSLTGLYDLRARYYDPAGGNFLSRDTLAASLQNPAQFDRYLYTSDNPVNRFDPSGHEALVENRIVDQEDVAVIDYALNQSYGDAFTSLIDDWMSGDPEWLPPDQAPVEPSIDPGTNPTGPDTSTSPEADQPDPTTPQAKTQPETPAKPNTSPTQDPEGPGTKDEPQPGNKPPCHCEMLTGPSYSRSGSIPWKVNGIYKQTKEFSLEASFMTNPDTGADPHCCEVRQEISWTGSPPGALMGKPDNTYNGGANIVWNEDVALNGTYYGHRGNRMGNTDIDQYLPERLNGGVYFGKDQPSTIGHNGETWYLRLSVIDTCLGGNTIDTWHRVATSDIVSVTW